MSTQASSDRAALLAENERLRAQLRATEERSRLQLEDSQRIQAELEKTIVYREQLMGVLGHDLRNPLSAVMGIAGLARLDPNLPPHAEAHIKQIDAAVRRMLEMIETLLDFTKARFSGVPIARANIDLRDVVQSVADEHVASRPHARITIHNDGDTRGAWDAARIAQVVSNLLGNALVHGEGNAVRVSITGEPEAVSLHMHNGGPAIAPEVLPSVFEPFRRGTTKAPGLGLGLFITQRIVQAHGGTTHVRSSEDEGTTFTVTLPRVAS